MDITAFLFFIFALQVLCLYVTTKSLKVEQTQQDYFLAGKSLTLFPLMMTLLATQVGGGIILGSAEEAYRFGWWVLLYPLGVTLGLIILGLGLGKRMAEFRVATVAQIFNVAYRSRNLKKFASCLSIVSLFFILIAQVIASSKFIRSLGVESELCFLAFWSIVIFYTVKGGLKGVIATDMVQAAFFIIVFATCFAFIATSIDRPLTEIAQSGYSDSFTFDESKLCGWLFMPMFFMLIEQDMAQRCFAAITPQTASKAAFWAGIISFTLAIIPVSLGIVGRALNIPISEGSSVLMSVMIATTGPYMSALVGCAIMAAIISTSDSLINAIGSNISQDFDFKLSVGSSKILSAIIAIGAIIFAYFSDNVLDMLIASYEMSVSCLFIPIVIALFKRQGSPLAATGAVISGACSFVLFKFVTVPIPKELAAVCLSLAGFVIGNLLAKKQVNLRSIISHW